MATVMRIDLRGKPPYYTLTRDPDRTVTVSAPAAPADDARNVSDSDLAGMREEILATFDSFRDIPGITQEQMQDIIMVQMYANHAWRSWKRAGTPGTRSWLEATLPRLPMRLNLPSDTFARFRGYWGGGNWWPR